MVLYKNLIYLLSLIAISIWIAVFSVNNNLYIIACDVGQGDAILIQKSTTQILIDSGPNNKVLDCLSAHMPFWDKQIELGILTHTDKDHSGGYIDVFKSYKIQNFLTNDFNKPVFSNQDIEVLKNMVGSSGTRVIYPSNDLKIRLGMIYLDILHPNADFISNSTNDYSIVNLLTYGNFKAIFTGDIEDSVSDLVSNNAKIEKVNYLKVPHHGSKNGLSEKLLEVIVDKSLPAGKQVAVISLSSRNTYGHPHKEVLDLLEKYKVKILRTSEVGDVVIVTDGIKMWNKK